MILAERHSISINSPMYKELDELCFKSKNLYNSALYSIRQHFFETGSYKGYHTIQKEFQNSNQENYRDFPAKVSQSILKLVDQNFQSFFALIKRRDITTKKRIPGYLDSVSGRQVVPYTTQAISHKELKKGFISLPKTRVKIKTKVDPSSVKQVRIVPGTCNTYTIEVIYEVQEKAPLEDNGRYCSIDLGLNNLAAVASNVIKPIIINGKPLKSINQFYNKTVSKLKSQLNKEHKTSKRIRSVTRKRNDKVADYLHKVSRMLVSHLVEHSINTLVIGYNKEWKQDIELGKRTNQNFVQIPFTRFIEMLRYKCKLLGIRVLEQEESYTSKCSFFDNEPVKKHDVYVGKRTKRGLFQTSTGRFVNADINGALNILKKAIGEFQYSIEVCSTPLVKTIKTI